MEKTMIEIKRREYSVEVYNRLTDKWDRQIDVFNTVEEAEEFCKENPLDDTEEYSIWCIEYDTDENEIDSYPME
jgi:hypothetical protein